MNLQLLYHPLASFCWKVSIALYENGVPFAGRIVDLGDPEQVRELQALWPVGKFPLLRGIGRDKVIPESSIIIEYIDRQYPAATPLIPADPERALQARLWDRFFDHYVHQPMQKLVADHMRAPAQRDAVGVADAVRTLETAYALLDRSLADSAWAAGPDFGIADCAAAPALFYAGVLVPFDAQYPNVAAYFDRLCARPSIVRTITEAQAYFHMFPLQERLPARFLDPAAQSFARRA